MDTLTRSSFFFSNVFLTGLTLITFIEAIRTPSQKLRNILNLETTVSCVAALFYAYFLQKIDEGTLTLDKVTPYRYLDWIITTPILLLVLMIFFKTPVHLTTFLAAALLNYAMLFAGYMGETGKISRVKGSVFGFTFFTGMILLLATTYGGSLNQIQWLIFTAFAVVWTGYGVVYWLDEEKKNIAYNTLDVIAKVFFGLFIWVYYANIFD